MKSLYERLRAGEFNTPKDEEITLYERLRAGEFNTPKDEGKSPYERLRAGEFNQPAVPETPDQTIAEPATIAPELPPIAEHFSGGYMPAYASAYPGAYPGQTETPSPSKYPVAAKDFAEHAGKYEKPGKGLMERLDEAFTITAEDAAKKPGAWETFRNTLGAMGATTMLPIYQLAKYLATGVGSLGRMMEDAPPGVVPGAITNLLPLRNIGDLAASELEKQIINDETFLALAAEQMQKGNVPQKFLYHGAPSIPSVLMTGMAGSALAQNLGAAMGTAAGTLSSAGQAVPAGYKAVADATPLAQALATKMVSMAPFGVHAAGSYAREAEREGADVPAQLAYAVSGAIFEILTEAPVFSRWAETIGEVGGDLLMRRGTESLLKKWGAAGLRALTDALAEAGQEAIVGPLAGVAKKTFVNKDMPWLGEGGVVDFSQMPEDAFGGFAMSTLLTAFGLPVSALSKRLATKALNDIEKGRPITLNEILEINQQLTKDLEKHEEQLKKEARTEQKTAAPGALAATEPPIRTTQDQTPAIGDETRSEPKSESLRGQKSDRIEPTVETKAPTERPGALETRKKTAQQPSTATGEPVKTESLKPGDIVYFKGSPVEFVGVDKDKVMVRIGTGLEHRVSKRDFERNYTAGLPAELQVEPSVRAAQETKLEEGAKDAAQQAKGETAEPRKESSAKRIVGEYYSVKPAQEKTEKHTPPERLSNHMLMTVKALRDQAKALDRQIEAKRNPAIAQLNPTARRARIAAGMAAEADRLERLQTTINRIADAMEDGSLAPVLSQINKKTQVETLLAVSRLENPSIFREHPEILKRHLEEAKGMKGIADIRPLVERVIRNSGISNSEKEVKAISRLVNILNKAGKSDYAVKTLKESVTKANRLLEMGIVDSDSLREAIKAIEPYVEAKPKEKTKEQLIREKEAALIGTKIPGYFPTPRTLAQNLVYRADIKPGMKVLEPSAGKGNIADQVPKEADLSVIEINPTLRDLLETKGYNVVDRDFLEHTGEYDRIVMNPPFEKGQDIDHVRHAYDLLKPGGKLVSIMSEGPFFRSDKKATEFREWFEEVGGTSEKLPAGSFTGPEAERQTGVNARIVEIEKEEVSPDKSQSSSLASADKTKEVYQSFPPIKEVQVNIENGELSTPEEWLEALTSNADQDSGISYTELRKDLSSEVKNALARIKSPEITTEIHRSDGETVQVKGEAVTPGMVIEKDEDGKFVLWHINSGKYIAKYRNRESAILCAKVLSQYGDLSALDESGVVQLVRENKLQKLLNQVALRDANNQFFPYDGMELVLGYKTADKIYKHMLESGENVFPYNKETAEAILQVKPKVSSILDLVTKKVWRTPNSTFINDKNSPVGHLVGSELLLFLNDEFKISDKKLTETATSQAKRKKRVIDDAGYYAKIKEWFETPISGEELSDPKWIDKDFVIFEVEHASEKEKYISISVPVYDYLTRKGYQFYYDTQGIEVIKIAKGDKVVGVVGPARVEKDVINENYSESLPPPPKKEDYLTVVRLKQTEPARTAEAKLQEQPRPVEGETKKSAEEELAERTNQYLKASGPPLKIVSYQVPMGKNEVRYQDPKLEEAFIAGHGVPQKSVLLSIQEYYVEFKNKLTRDLEHLPNEPRFEEARTSLHRLLKQVGVSNTRAKHIVRGILYRLDRKQLGLYERAVVLYDIAEELKRDNPSVPAVFTKEKVEEELEHINRLVNNDPIVKEALALRKKEMNDLVEEYVQAMKSIGLDVEDRFTRENYFHHQVLEYANLHGVFNRKKVKTPSGSGFLKQREGYKGLYNTNYLQVETQVISEMLHAIEIARTIQKIDQHYNIAEQLKRKAFQINEENTMEYFREIIRQSDDYDPKTLEEDAGKLFRSTLNWKQADAINRLSALAAQGELPLGDKGEFKDIVSELAEDPEGINFKRLLAYANYLVKTDQETGKAEAAQLFRGIKEKRKAMEEILGKEFITWENIIPEGYTKWQPREGSLMFLTESIPAQLAEQLRQGIVESLQISSDDLKTIRAIGGEREWYVIPEEVALTLDNLQRPAPKSWFYKGIKAVTKAWKRFRIGNPKTNVKYQFRNVSSDAEWTALGNPRAFKRVPGVVKELYNVIVKDYAPTGEMKEFFMRGGFEAGELGQEVGNIDQLKMFKHLVEKKGTVAEAPLKVWQSYWKVVNISNNFREAILRYANYLEYLDQMKKNNGVPLNWGASDEKTVMALSDIRDRAYLMANQLVGAYDRVSVITQEASDTALPFFRFQEVNFKRYSQWIKNQARDGRAATAVGKHFLGKLAKSPRLAYNVGKLILKAIGLTSILAAWNHLFFPDEEEDLPADVRSSPHLIYGRDKQGNVLYLSRLGALEDFIEWFGVDEPYGLVQDFLNGRKNLKDIALDMAKGPVNKLTQALNPLFKVPAEIATGHTIFPDVFEPRRIRDKWLYLAQQLELEEEYRALAKLPRREGYLASWKRALFNVAAPGESAYWDIIDLKHNFLKSKTGGSSYTITDTKRSNALYNMKLALRYKDKEAYEHYMAEYFNAGGTRSGMSRSLATLDPLYGLGKYEREFRQGLTKEEQAKLRKATDYYRSILR